ncbi:uncharacterized protein N7496_003736 [Penicillium cataractarum]|uniref:WHIM1 domain-containing protein n=1 Tax=Penicillium cataractarum TaxID=2100454 RepID=A0A9W9VGH4_9EURO|nr:uncharacterized protein N7496_003736 [Penicillium cataractarum]KAJ5381308.1 hypothetical protein N7496_003736 [Penicillium cataractarum]
MAHSDSDLSSLSSAPPTDDEAAMAIDEPVGIAKYFKKESETPPPKREPSPPHEYVLADNPNIAFIVTFRARFHEAFPRGLPHFGPQDIEKGVEDSVPGEYIERLLCALLGLVLNRKKDVERNHYTRPLEEAIQVHQSQWPKAWEGKNPLHGGRTFATMSPEERLELLRALMLWSLSSSDAIQAKIKESYKQSRHDDDLNQPLSVQPWGRDSLKRRYWLIEGQDDTHFRLYRESNPALKTITWWSVAGDIPEMQAIADRLQEEKGTNSKKLSERIRAAIPRFEASEEKRKRRDYRLARKAAFARPEPGFSLYEGRTRGKKLKYTYDDDEDIFSDDQPTRRSARNSSGVTAAEPSRPRFTASGRQVRSRAGGAYGESLLSGQREDSDYDEEDGARPQRSRTSTHPNGYSGYGLDDLDDESEARSNDSGNEWDGGDEEENDFEGDDEGEDASGDESVVNGEPRSLVVQLRYSKGSASGGPKDPDEPPPAKDVPMEDATQAGVSQESYIPKETPQLVRASEPAAVPSMTAPAFPSVPAPQVPAQPAVPKMTGLPMSALLNTPEPVAQPPPSGAPKTAQPVGSNGWNGSHPDAVN